MHFNKYEALHKCPQGHEFMAPADPFNPDNVSSHRCPECLEAFLKANVPDGLQVGGVRQVPTVQTINL